MSGLIDRLMNTEFDRRKFIKGTAALTAAATASIPLSGCGSSLEVVEVAHIDTEKGRWVPAPCWHNCGGKCLNKALVVDGVVVRQKTDDLKPDTPEFPQQRACLRGRSQQQQALGADRLKYPMKRKNWEPGGGKKELRGQDEWVRITWEEALDLIASEIKRITEAYGTEAIMSTGGNPHALLTQLGSYVRPWGTISWGAWYAGNHLLGIGDGCNVSTNLNDRFDMQNCELAVCFGLNPAWSALGNATNFYLEMKKKGCQFIMIDPIYTDAAAVLDAEWIPIHPGTDQALILALAYTMIDEDDPEKNPLIDWDFLNRCTYGFDAEHMPPDAKTNENFKDYVLGAYDDTPKTPEWASEICGIEPDVIRRLARRMGKNVKLALLTGWANARTFNNDSLPQMFLTLGMMGGHFGRSGHMTGVSCWNYTANFGPRLVKTGGTGMKTEYKTHPVIPINDTECWPAVLGESFNPTPVFSAINGDPAGWKEMVEKLDTSKEIERITANIQMIWHSASANLQTRDGMRKGIEAHRKVEFVLSQSSFLTTNSKYADIVLPITTLWERTPDLLGSTNRDMILVYDQVIEPLYEAKDDNWVNMELAKRLGLDPDAMYPMSPQQQFFNRLKGCTVITEDGKDFEPLLTITQADIDEMGVEGEPQEGRIDLKKFLEDGIYQVERYKGDPYGYIAYEDFVKDPEKNPLYSTTGKFEIYSQTLSDVIGSQGFSKVPPIPKYTQVAQGYESTFSDWDNKVKGDYPYQCVNPHYQRRSHSILDNLPWLREAMVSPFFISAQDAKEKGVRNGDTVLITSEFGQTLRQAYVTERIMPGVVGLPHGSWVDVDEKTGIDKAGADNYIVGNTPTGQGVSGWNTQKVNFEKWTGDPLPADKDVPQRILF